ncbi:NeuD/PglB/VioB family sugar acetyltransferase [Thiomicrospira microaerophila]|uniref:NeuD/PglB/VioB family sugar acetyltransferase n=1 Tax=Thiomicrospira microaerophila TaxID=406020 RepID=UPI0005CAAC97|nr:NeuD/PglB/VioB family sugar acetyltransferase [Thiomicrospira microaerophila]
MMPKPAILLIGAGGHCKACIDVIEQSGQWQIAGIVDRKGSGVEDVLGYPVIGCDEDLPRLRQEFDYAFVTVGQLGSVELKIKLFNHLKALGFKQPGLVSPLAYVSKHAQIGEGTIVMHYAMLNASARVASNCIINSHALIEHDALIEDHCHVSTGAKINGGAQLGQACFVGSGAILKQNVIRVCSENINHCFKTKILVFVV